MIVFCIFSFVQQNTLNATILRSAEEGLSGIVIWGDHHDIKSMESCKQLQSYVKTALGPTVKLTIEAATNCSKRLCSGNGRCKGKILQCKQLYHHLPPTNLKLQSFKKSSNTLVGLFPSHLDENDKQEANSSNKKSGSVHADEGCTCLCFTDWSGIACDIPS